MWRPFTRAIEELNNLQSLAEAQAFLSRWLTDKTDPQVREEFRQWVLSRFSEK